MSSPQSLTELKLARLEELAQLRALVREREANKFTPYLYDPAKFLHDMFDWRDGEAPASYQVEALETLVEQHRLALRSCHGAGKTTTVSFADTWFAVTRELCGIDWKVQVTAGVWRQLVQFTMPEHHLWFKRLRWDRLGREPFIPNRELLDLSLKLSHGAMSSMASNDPEKVEGAHAREAMAIIDEAKSVQHGTWDAVEGIFANAGADTTSNAYVLAVSTPGQPSGRFYDINQRKPGYEDWAVRHIRIEEAVAAGRVSAEWVEKRRIQWGEDSAVFRSKVLGEFSADDEDSVIPLAWIEQANERWHDWVAASRPDLPGARWCGVDVGRGGDETVLAKRLGPVLILSASRTRDTMDVVRLCAEVSGRCIVDTVGVGAGVFDRLKQMGLKPRAYVGSGKSKVKDRSRQYDFVNVRSAAYWRLREMLDPEYEPTLCLPPDDLLMSDLTTPHWSIASETRSTIKIENKEDVVKRLGRSPDRGDAVVMALFADAMSTPARPVYPTGQLGSTGLSPLG